MNNNMFTARGDQAKESANKKKVDLKETYLRMKSGDSIKVRVLSEVDYVEYLAHGSFSHGIYTQPCISVIGEECPLCIASKSGEEGYDVLYAKKRYIFVFAELQSTELKVLEVSKNQAKKLIADIEEYKDNLGEIAFNLKKVGEGVSTGYTLAPILKMKGEEPEQFEACGDLEVTDEYLNTVLQPRTVDLQAKILKDSGFPIEKHMPHIKPLEDKNDDNKVDNGVNASGVASEFNADDVINNM